VCVNDVADRAAAAAALVQCARESDELIKAIASVISPRYCSWVLGINNSGGAALGASVAHSKAVHERTRMATVRHSAAKSF
jgi:hypothetical protein